MSGNANAEDLVLRIKPAQKSSRFGLSWLGSRAMVALIAAAAAILAGVMYMILQDAGSFSRRRPEFPPPPQLAAAIAAAQERLKVNPQDLTTLVELGTLHFEKGKEFYPDAINELEEARDLGALDPRVFYCLGIMYQEVGLYSFALDEYKRFLRHYPDDKEIRLLEAKLLYKQKDFPEAVSEFERLRYHYPGDSLIEENLGLSLWAAKAVDRAIESFNQLKAQGGDQARRAEYYLGQIELDRSRAPQALEHLLLAQPRLDSPDFGVPREQVHAALANAYQKAGQYELAKAAWEQVVSEASGDDKAKAAKALKEVSRRAPPPAKKPTRSKKS